jgi:cobalt-zinc-cadmium efflux system outer membrane protein
LRGRSCSRASLALSMLIVAVSASLAEDPETKRYILTLSEVRELARSRAPSLLAARARVDIARGERVNASIWQPTNPELIVAAGPRRLDGEKTGTDIEIGIGQRFELGGRRRSRVERADASIARADATSSDAERELLRSVSASFLAALHAERSFEVAQESEQLFGEIRRVTEQRYEAGDVGILDPYAAAMAHARSRARLAKVEATRVLAARELRALLGLENDAEIVVKGDLVDRRQYALEALIEQAAHRPDLKAIEAKIGGTQAEQRLARGFRSPDLGAFINYSQEEGADIFKGGVSIVLPFVDKGQGRLAVAEARERAFRFDLQAARSVVGAEVRSWFEAFSLLDSAASRFESDDLPRVQEMLDLARRSYESGNIPFAELLILQRETIETRLAYLDLLLQAALVSIELEAAAGVL